MALQATKKLMTVLQLATKRGIKLKWLIIIPFIVQMGASIGLSAWLAYRQGLSGIEDQARRLLKSSSLNISTQLENYLLTPELVTEINSQAIELGTISTTEFKSWGPYLIKQSQLFPQLNFIYYGDQQGNYVHINRHHSQPIFEMVFKDPTTNGKFQQFAYDLRGNRVPIPEVIKASLDQSYDPRPRPWYGRALKVKQATWTDSYRFIDIKPNFGISHVTPVFRTSDKPKESDKRVKGVLGADFSLLGINLFLERLAIGKSGKAFIIEKSGGGNLIASSAPYPLIGKQRPTVWDIDDPVIRDTATFLGSKFEQLNQMHPSQSLDFKSQSGKRYLLSVEPFQGHRGLDWLIIVAIPESDLTTPLEQQNFYLGMICILAWLLTILLGWLTARMIVQALKAVQKGTIEIAQGNLSLRLDEQKLEEINRLTQSFNLMSQKLVIDRESAVKELTLAQKSLNTSEENFKTTFFSAPIPMAILTLDEGQLIEVNDALISAGEYARTEMIGKSSLDLGFWCSVEEREQVYERLKQAGSIGPIETEWMSRGGQVRNIMLSAKVIEFNGEPCALFVAKDITERKAAELSLITAKKLAQNANRMKSEFLANMSHELRTPLNAILGLTEILQEQVVGSVNPQQIGFLETIEQSGNHLLEVINDVLDLSKIESGEIQLELEPTKVEPLCESSLTFVQQQAFKKNVQLTMECLPNLAAVMLDKRRICQVLINLLSNAVKFTEAGGSVTLQVGLKDALEFPTTEQVSLKHLQFRVSDTGIGITSENLDRLFQPFVQVDTSLNRRNEGTGLGLALVKRIVELHDGGISVVSTPSVGSTFTITLPCHFVDSVASDVGSEEESRLAVDSTRADSEGALPLVLIAEDNEANITTLVNYLSYKSYRLIVAHDGQEAFLLAQSDKPDLILMDIQMPGVNGLDAIRQIRALPNFKTLPIIALTALAMPGDRERCLEAGATDYFAKPFSLKQLVQRMQQLLA